MLCKGNVHLHVYSRAWLISRRQLGLSGPPSGAVGFLCRKFRLNLFRQSSLLLEGHRERVLSRRVQDLKPFSINLKPDPLKTVAPKRQSCNPMQASGFAASS